MEPLTDYEATTIRRAEAILLRRIRAAGELLTSAPDVRRYLRMRMGHQARELFGVIYLDTRHRLIHFDSELFAGTIDRASVYPREIVRAAMHHNAAAVILAHNHPSGVAEPSAADLAITEQITKGLRLVDVRVLDHCVVTGDTVVSFAERGLL